MKNETIQHTAYLRGEMRPEEAAAWRAKVDADPRLRKDMEETRRMLELAREWRPPQGDPALTDKIMARVRRAPRPVQKKPVGISVLITWIKTLALNQPLTAGLVMASLAAGLIIILNPPHQWNQSGVNPSVKETPVLTQGPRLPKPTLLMEIKTPNPDAIMRALDQHNIRIESIQKYPRAAVLEIKAPEGVDLAALLNSRGRIIRYNPGYLNSQGMAVIVVRYLKAPHPTAAPSHPK